MAAARYIFLSVAIFCLSRSALANQLRIESGEVSNCNHGVLDNVAIRAEDGAFSMDMEILKEMSENCELGVVIKAGGQVMYDDVVAFCECFDDEMVGKDCVAKGKPDGEFPTACPAKPGKYTIEKMVVSEDKIRGCPDGPLEVLATFMCDGEACCELKVNGEIMR